MVIDAIAVGALNTPTATAGGTMRDRRSDDARRRGRAFVDRIAAARRAGSGAPDHNRDRERQWSPAPNM
jgi:hypothetical protein